MPECTFMLPSLACHNSMHSCICFFHRGSGAIMVPPGGAGDQGTGRVLGRAVSGDSVWLETGPAAPAVTWDGPRLPGGPAATLCGLVGRAAQRAWEVCLAKTSRLRKRLLKFRPR